MSVACPPLPRPRAASARAARRLSALAAFSTSPRLSRFALGWPPPAGPGLPGAAPPAAVAAAAAEGTFASAAATAASSVSRIVSKALRKPSPASPSGRAPTK
eukprot:8253411-Pyramimonas_sp.AAC.1